MSQPMIEVEALSKSFGQTRAVINLSFAVQPGTVLGMLGPNGAGKTTTVNMLTTLLAPDGGHATIAGFDVARQPELVRQVIGLAGQAAAVDEQLSARENLRLFGALYHLPRATLRHRADDLVDRFGMGDFADRPASTYSGGERRRLDLVVSLVADPPVLFLDEPSAGLDPRRRNQLWDELRQLVREGTTVVLTTQYLDEADALCDQVLVIDRGKSVATGSPDELKDSVQRDVVEVRLTQPSDLPDATAALSALPTSPVIDAERAMLSIPVTDGAATALDALRRLDAAGVAIEHFELRRPTLDDVFLTLTASTSGNPGGGA